MLPLRNSYLTGDKDNPNNYSANNYSAGKLIHVTNQILWSNLGGEYSIGRDFLWVQ